MDENPRVDESLLLEFSGNGDSEAEAAQEPLEPFDLALKIRSMVSPEEGDDKDIFKQNKEEVFRSLRNMSETEMKAVLQE